VRIAQLFGQGGHARTGASWGQGCRSDRSEKAARAGRQNPGGTQATSPTAEGSDVMQADSSQGLAHSTATCGVSCGRAPDQRPGTVLLERRKCDGPGPNSNSFVSWGTEPRTDGSDTRVNLKLLDGEASRRACPSRPGHPRRTAGNGFDMVGGQMRKRRGQGSEAACSGPGNRPPRGEARRGRQKQCTGRRNGQDRRGSSPQRAAQRTNGRTHRSGRRIHRGVNIGLIGLHSHC